MRARERSSRPIAVRMLLPALLLGATLAAPRAKAGIKGEWEVAGSAKAVYSTKAVDRTVRMPTVRLAYTDTLSFGADGSFASSYGSGGWTKKADGSIAVVFDRPSVLAAFATILGDRLPGVTILSVASAVARASQPTASSLEGRITVTLGVTTAADGAAIQGKIAWTADFTASRQIKGLAAVDFTVAWDRWDSDAPFDGLSMQLYYLTSRGNLIAFQRKPHRVRVEFFTQKPGPDGYSPTFDQLFFTHEFTVRDSRGVQRITEELYRQSLADAGYDLGWECLVFLKVTVFPPLGKPRSALTAGYPDQLVWGRWQGDLTPNP